MWIKTFDEFGIKYLEDADLYALQVYCETNLNDSVINNSSFEDMKIKEFSGDNGQYLITYHIPTMTIINACAMHKIILGDLEDVWRIGTRNATLKAWREKLFSLGYLNNLSGRYLYPIQITDALAKGAKTIIVTTNSKAGGFDSSGQMFKADSALNILSKKGFCKHLFEDVEIYGVIQNVWELVPKKWIKQ